MDERWKEGEKLTALTTRSDEGGVVLARDVQRESCLTVDVLRDGEDGGLSGLGSSLGTSEGHFGCDSVIRGLVNVDRDLSLLLDLVDLRAGLAEDARERLDRDGESDDVAVLLGELDQVDELLLGGQGALLPAANGDVVRGLVGLGKVDPYVVRRLKTLRVGTLLADEGSTLEGRGERDSQGDLVRLVSP